MLGLLISSSFHLRPSLFSEREEGKMIRKIEEERGGGWSRRREKGGLTEEYLRIISYSLH
jgi:hypothetical protein